MPENQDPRPASSPGANAMRTGGAATLLLLLCQYRGVPIALWLIGVPPAAPEYQSAGTWLAPLLAGSLLGGLAWLGSELRDYVHAVPSAPRLLRIIAKTLP